MRGDSLLDETLTLEEGEWAFHQVRSARVSGGGQSLRPNFGSETHMASSRTLPLPLKEAHPWLSRRSGPPESLILPCAA